MKTYGLSVENRTLPLVWMTLWLGKNPWLFAVQVSRTRSSALIAEIQGFPGSSKQEKNPMFCVDGILRIQSFGEWRKPYEAPNKKAWQSYNAFGLCKYLGSLKCKMLRFTEISRVHPAFSSRFRVSRFWAPSRANGWCRCAATWQLGSNHLTDHYFQHHIWMKSPWNDSREMTMKWPSLWICAATYTQSKALRVNISAKVKGSAGAVSTGLVWPWTKTLQKVNRINAFSILEFFLSSFVSALRLKWI